MGEIETPEYKGPDRRCKDCPVQEVAVEKTNIKWLKTIVLSLAGLAVTGFLPFAYSKLDALSAQQASLSTKVASIGTAQEATKETLEANSEMLRYLRNKLDDLAARSK